MRRRVDLSRLPAWARYGIAFAVLGVVLALVLAARPDAAGADAPGWYTVVVTVGAIGLLAYLVGRLAWRIARRARRR